MRETTADGYAQLQADVYYLAGHKGDYDHAVARITEFERSANETDRLRAGFLRAGVLHAQGQLETALSLYRPIYESITGDARLKAACCVEMAAAANALGEFDLVDALFDDALQIVEDSPEAAESLERIYVAHAESLLLRGQYAAAELWYRRCLSRLEDPYGSALVPADRACGIAFAWYGLAKVHLALGDMIRARFSIQGIRAAGSRRTINTLEALAEARFHLRSGAISRVEEWLNRAESSIPDPELSQEAFLLWLRVYRLKGHQAAVEKTLAALNSFPFLKYEVRSEMQADTLREVMK